MQHFIFGLIILTFPSHPLPKPYHRVETNTLAPIVQQIQAAKPIKELPLPSVEPLLTLPTVAEPQPTASAPTSAPSGSCGDNEAAHYIYMHESGCRTDAIAPNGACSLGQAWPCSKLSNVCPNWQTDYACDNNFFTAYANSKGGWEAAANIWRSKGWW